MRRTEMPCVFAVSAVAALYMAPSLAPLGFIGVAVGCALTAGFIAGLLRL